jgi:transcriptional regulator with XRE-family HTH domain
MTESSFTHKLSKKIRLMRLKRKMTQDDVSEYGVDVKQYQRIERGLVNPKAYTLYKLSKAFKCSVEEFF